MKTMTSLSESNLWELMQDYYNNIGPKAWEEEIVPLQISSNKNLAANYADIIVSHINDWHQHNFNPTTSINKENKEPFYIIELGAGHGKFSYYVIKFLKKLIKNFELSDESFVYVMTDISEKNISSWQKHPAFIDWIQQGILDFAYLNAINQQEMVLKCSKKTISQYSLKKPIVLICNYLFDSLPHDAFQVKNHKLYETQIQIKSGTNWKDYFEKAVFKYKQRLINVIHNGYYQDPAIDNILQFYQNYFKEASFLIPIGGIKCIENIQQFTNSHVLLLLADKGESNLELLEGLQDPDISVHGSVSLMVNFDAITRYFNNKKGTSLLMPNSAAEFQVAGYCTKSCYPTMHTQHAFNRSFAGLGPQDIISLCYKDEAINDNFSSLDELLALLNLSLWDPSLFFDMHDMILEKIEETDGLTIEQEQNLLYGAEQVFEYFFKLEKNQDIPFTLGSLYYALNKFEQAIYFYQLSIKLFGIDPDTLYNIALSYQMLALPREATKYAKKTLQNDPNYKLAKEIIEELT